MREPPAKKAKTSSQQHDTLTLLAADGSTHALPRAAALHASELLQEMLSATGKSDSSLDVPTSGAATAAFTAYVRQQAAPPSAAGGGAAAAAPAPAPAPPPPTPPATSAAAAAATAAAAAPAGGATAAAAPAALAFPAADWQAANFLMAAGWQRELVDSWPCRQ